MRCSAVARMPTFAGWGTDVLAVDSMTVEERREMVAVLDSSLGQIRTDTAGVHLCGWPLEARRSEWERCHEALLTDAWVAALVHLATAA